MRGLGSRVSGLVVCVFVTSLFGFPRRSVPFPLHLLIVSRFWGVVSVTFCLFSVVFSGWFPFHSLLVSVTPLTRSLMADGWGG